MSTQMEYSQASSGAFSAAHRVLHDDTVFTVADLRLQVQTIVSRTPATCLIGPSISFRPDYPLPEKVIADSSSGSEDESS